MMVTNNANIIPFNKKECIMTVKTRTGKKYFAWREAVFKCDNYECQHCGITENIIAHHIIPWEEAFELRIDVNNGLTLCMSCHMLHYDYGYRIPKGNTPWNKGTKGISVGMPKGSEFSEDHKRKLSEAKKS